MPANGCGCSILPFSVAKNLPQDATSIIRTVDDNGKQGIIVGNSNFELQLGVNSSISNFNQQEKNTFTSLEHMIGPLSQADIDNDGDLDIFAGGRVIPAKYPMPASSILYINKKGEYLPDNKNSMVLSKLGLVSSSVFSDIDNDGDPDLLLALEWGPITILENNNGIFKNITKKLNLDRLKGWWNGIATGDFNEDGLIDIVATNWGLNTKYHFTTSHPRKVYFDDFDNNNVLDIVEAHYDGDFEDLVTERGFSWISNAMPFVRQEKQTFLNYAQSTLTDIFGNSLETSPYLEANTL